MNTTHERFALLMTMLVLVLIGGAHGRNAFANEPPVANAGLPRYAAAGPVQLDGSGSYDPDASGPLTYTWRQLSGPLVTMTDANSATPLIIGPSRTDARGRPIAGAFVQTDAIQECEFELVVSDGELTSLPDTVNVIIVPDFGVITLQQQNPPFNPTKPTVFYFSGGDCVNGFANEQSWGNAAWFEKANIINFPAGYAPDTISPESWRTYYRYGDMIIVYLSSVAPDYTGMIQTMGWSTGGQPAVDAAIRLNRFYHDSRYAVNHVTEFDAPCRWQFINWEAYIASNELLHSSAVDGELLRHDHYWGEAYRLVNVPRDLVGVYLEGHDHAGVRDWYRSSLTSAAANEFNHGVVAGAFWSVVGPGRNLQVTADAVGHYFHRTPEGDMVMFDENAYPGRFPEPVTLGAWVSVSDVSGRVDGAVLSCYESENAVGYQLLFGADPYRVMDYRVVSDTNLPPMDVIREFPSEETWWTVRVRDQYGSTIYADPIRLDLTGLSPLSVENARTGKTYGLIGHAILDAEAGDTILVGPATYDENIEFSGKTLTVRSLDPNDPVVVAGTIVRGQDSTPTVTFSGPESGACTLSGLTIQSGTVGVSCRDAVPTIRNCVVQSPDGIAIEFWIGCEPRLVDCTVLGRVREGGDPGLIAYWTFDETAGGVASDNGGEHDANVVGNPLWQPEGGKVGGALELSGVGNYVTTGLVRDPSAGPFSVFVWVKGGAPGQVILSQEKGANWLMASSPDGALMTDLKSAGRQAKALTSTTVVTDGNWHRVGLSWDGSNRILYVDDVEVARDTQASLAGTGTGLYFGAGSKLATDAFWKGLIDDVRIYNRAVAP